jgi:hypothetical protein
VSRAPLALALAALALAGCGDDEQAGNTLPTVAVPAATAPAATVPPVTATAPATTPTVTLPPSTAGGQPAPGAEDLEGGGGDEEGVRVPAQFTLDGSSATPQTVDVPAFLPVEVSFVAADRANHEVTIMVVPPVTIRVVGAAKVTKRRLPGLKRGSYPLVIDGKESGALLRVGQSEPGP